MVGLGAVRDLIEAGLNEPADAASAMGLVSRGLFQVGGLG
jgi:hypothetical protein